MTLEGREKKLKLARNLGIAFVFLGCVVIFWVMIGCKERENNNEVFWRKRRHSWRGGEGFWNLNKGYEFDADAKDARRKDRFKFEIPMERKLNFKRKEILKSESKAASGKHSQEQDLESKGGKSWEFNDENYKSNNSKIIPNKSHHQSNNSHHQYNNSQIIPNDSHHQSNNSHNKSNDSLYKPDISLVKGLFPVAKSVNIPFASSIREKTSNQNDSFSDLHSEDGFGTLEEAIEKVNSLPEIGMDLWNAKLNSSLKSFGLEKVNSVDFHTAKGSSSRKGKNSALRSQEAGEDSENNHFDGLPQDEKSMNDSNSQEYFNCADSMKLLQAL